MSITGSCGCIFTDADGENGMGNFVCYRAHDNGDRVVVFATVCNKCKQNYIDENLILHNQEEQNNWLAKGSFIKNRTK